MLRPETASKNRNLRPRILYPRLNQSSNKITPYCNEPQRQNNAEQIIYESNDEVRTQVPKSTLKAQIDKYELATMLMKFQLEKMGFKSKKQQNMAEKYVKRANLDEYEPRNLRQWVLNKKSEVVTLLFLQDEQRQYYYDSVSISSKKSFGQKIGNKKEQQVESKIPSTQRHVMMVQIPLAIKIAPPKSQEREQHQQIVCPICLTESKKYVKLKCGHIFCSDCVREYIIENMATGNYIIDCPEEMCYQKVEENVAKLVLNNSQLQRFTHFRQKVILENNPDNKFCIRPDCGKLLKETKQKKLFCEKCNITFCQTCQEPEHPNKACTQFLNEQINETYKNFKIKKCPSCSSPIQKIDGCNHMTCKKCKTQFCWICLDKYTPYHYRIYNCCGCPGLQFEQAEERGHKRFLQVLFFIFLPLLLVLAISAVFLVLPLFMIFDFFTKPCKWLSDDPKCQIEILGCLCCCLPECLIAIIGYFVLLPRSALGCIFVSPVQYVAIIVNIVCNIV